MILFVPDSAARAIERMRAALPGSEWEVERRGLFRSIVRASVTIDGARLELRPLDGGSLSAELRARRDRSLDALAAFRIHGEGPVERLESASGGWLRRPDPSPVLRGLALCALVARLQAEDDDYEGRTGEPERLRRWLESHGAAIALSEEEAEWLDAPINALPEQARFASLADRLRSHAYALGLVADPEGGDLHELMSRFGFLADDLPGDLAGAKIRPGRESFLG